MDVVAMDRRYAVLLLQSLQLAHLVVAGTRDASDEFANS